MKWKMGQFLLAWMVFAMPAISQTNDATTADQLKKLLQLKGYWETRSAKMQTEGREFTFAYYANFKSTAAARGLIMTEWANIPGMGKLNGTNLIGIGSYDGKVHWFSVDNMGTAHEHIGEFVDSKHFSMVHKGIQNAREYVETISIELKENGLMSLKESATLDGKETLLITGIFHRVKTN